MEWKGHTRYFVGSEPAFRRYWRDDMLQYLEQKLVGKTFEERVSPNIRTLLSGRHIHLVIQINCSEIIENLPPIDTRIHQPHLSPGHLNLFIPFLLLTHRFKHTNTHPITTSSSNSQNTCTYVPITLVVSLRKTITPCQAQTFPSPPINPAIHQKQH